ncbi:hypothetical protein JNW90_01440 [Micromonospora sp. STR1s_5]|nr:hypothetical protein [Micromonospora sp. STR1s_5]
MTRNTDKTAATLSKTVATPSDPTEDAVEPTTEAPAEAATAPAGAVAAERVLSAAMVEPVDDGLVEVELTAHHRHNGTDYLPGAKIRVTAERADALRWAGRAKR